MAAFIHVTVGQIRKIHDRAIEDFGGSRGEFIGAEEIISSAIATISGSFDGILTHPTPGECAGLYMYLLIKKHPFVDGNKRTGAACALFFLRLNGIPVDCLPSNDSLTALAVEIAKNRKSRQDTVDFFQRLVVWNIDSEG